MKPLQLITIQSILLISLIASADNKVKQVADWTLWESDDGKTCYILTDDYSYDSNDPFNSNVTVSFGFSKTKNNPDHPVEIILRYKVNNNKNTAALLSLSGVDSIALADYDGKRQNYWGLGKNLSSFVSKATAGRGMITVKPVGGRAKEVDLSTAGLKDIMSEMELRCNEGNALVNLEFENLFLSDLPKTVNPANLNPEKIQNARTVYFAGYQSFSNIQKAKIDLERVLAKYRPLEEELNRNLRRIEQINSVELPQQRHILAESLQQQAQARTEISRLDLLIPSLTTNVSTSQKAYDQARAILAPHEPEYNRLTNALNVVRSQLRSAQERLESIDSRMTELPRMISNLDYEAQNLERSLPQKRRELDNAYEYLRDAQYRRSQFDPRRETERALRRNRDYERLEREHNLVQSNLGSVESELRRLQSEKAKANKELEVCRSEKPQKDCSVQQNALNAVEQSVIKKQAEERELTKELTHIRSRLRDIEKRIEHEVRYEYEQLVRDEDNARRHYEILSQQMSRDQDRITQIRHREIPNLESEYRQLSSERPSVITSIQRSNNEIARLSDELSRFKTATDWDRKYTQVQRTRSQLASDQQVLASAQAELANQKRLLANNLEIEAQAKATIESLNNQLTSLAQRNSYLRSGLSQLPAERAEFDKKIEVESNLFESQKKLLLELLVGVQS